MAFPFSYNNITYLKEVCKKFLHERKIVNHPEQQKARPQAVRPKTVTIIEFLFNFQISS